MIALDRLRSWAGRLRTPKDSVTLPDLIRVCIASAVLATVLLALFFPGIVTIAQQYDWRLRTAI
jgi:hypothetical protein